MIGVVPGKASVLLPPRIDNEDPEVQTATKNPNGKICVVLLTARSNSPLGVFDPTMRETNSHFTAMQNALEEKASEFNYLGGTTSLVAGDGRTSGNTIMNTMYFRDRESVARFAASGVHMVSVPSLSILDCVRILS